MSETIKDQQGNEYPIWKQSSRKYLVEGPNGRFFAPSKREAQRLLNETGGVYDTFYARLAGRKGDQR